MGIRSLFGSRGFSSKPMTTAFGVELGDTEPLRVGDAVEQRARAEVARFELSGDVGQLRPAQDVVTKDAAEGFGTDEVARETDGLGDAVGAGLVAVGQIEPEVRSVAEQLDHVADALAADDDQHLTDTHAGERLDRVVDHRPVVDRQQVLVRDDRQREQPGRGPARQHDALHGAEA